MIWDEESEKKRTPPDWTLTGQMLLWPDGSPAHVQQDPFTLVGNGWQAVARISRSTRDGSRWPTVIIRLDAAVRIQWDQSGEDPRERAKQALGAYLQLREWYGDDLGVLTLG